MSSIIRGRSGLTVLVSLMESSFLIEVDNTSILRTGALHCYHYTLNRLPAPRLLLPCSGLERSDFVPWPIATEIHVPRNVGDQGKSGLVVLNVSFVARGPNVWSGRAVQEVSSIRQIRSCINVSGLWLERVVLRAIMDISAHAI